MTPQDFIFAIGGVIFAVSLLPAVRNKATAMPLKTSLPTGLVLAVYTATFATMGLWLSMVCQGIVAACWLFIAARRRPGAQVDNAAKAVKYIGDTYGHYEWHDSCASVEL